MKQINYIISLTTGIFSGIIFFGGLMWTVKKLPTAKRPALLSISSMVFRMGIVMGAFYLVLDGQWQNAVMCLAGFLLARIGFSAVFKKGGIKL